MSQIKKKTNSKINKTHNKTKATYGKIKNTHNNIKETHSKIKKSQGKIKKSHGKNPRYTISFSVSKISFIYMTLIDSTNDQNSMRRII